MSEPDGMDALLRDAFANAAVPAVSASFERRIVRYVSRRELTSTGRGVLTAYTVAAIALSIWMMRSVSIDWSWIAAAILTPAGVTAVTLRRRST